MWSVFAVVCPPVAVLATGRVGQAALNVGLTLLLYVPGAVHALAVVGRHQTDRRNDALIRAVELAGG